MKLVAPGGNLKTKGKKLHVTRLKWEYTEAIIWRSTFQTTATLFTVQAPHLLTLYSCSNFSDMLKLATRDLSFSSDTTSLT